MRRLEAANPSSQALLVFVISVIKYGLGVFTSWPIMWSIARNWRSPQELLGPNQFRLASSTASLAAGVAHLTSARAFLAFSTVVATGALVGPFFMASARRSPTLRWMLGLAIVGGAVPAITMGWIGGYDAVTIIAITLAVLGETGAVRYVGWTLFAFNNGPEFALAGLLVAAIVVRYRRDEWRRLLIPLLGGGFTGLVAITLLLHRWGASVSRLRVYQTLGPSRIAIDALRFWPLTLVTALGAMWFFLASRSIRRQPEARFLLGAALASAVVIPLVAWDESRVLATVLWAPLLTVLVRLDRDVETVDLRRALVWTTPVALAVVLVLTFDGGLVYAGWGSIVPVLHFLFTGHGAVPTVG